MASKKERRRITNEFFKKDLPAWHKDILDGHSVLGSTDLTNCSTIDLIKLDNIIHDSEECYGINQNLMYVGPYSKHFTDRSNQITEIGLCVKQLNILSTRMYDHPPMVYTCVSNPMFKDWCYERDTDLNERTVKNDILDRWRHNAMPRWHDPKYIKLTHREAKKYILWAIRQLKSPIYAYKYSRHNVELRWDKSIVGLDGDRFPYLSKVISSLTQVSSTQCIGLYGAVGKTSKDRAFNKRVVLTVLNRHIHNNMRCIGKSTILRVVFDAECGPDDTLKTHVVLLKVKPDGDVFKTVTRIFDFMKDSKKLNLKTIHKYNYDGSKTLLLDDMSINRSLYDID